MDWGAQRNMGHVHFEGVMAANANTEEETFIKPFDCDKRPIHVAFLNKKLPCLHQFCSKNVFFDENGLDHHCRAIHRVKVNDDVITAARSLLNTLHGFETRRCLQEFFHLRSTQV